MVKTSKAHLSRKHFDFKLKQIFKDIKCDDKYF